MTEVSIEPFTQAHLDGLIALVAAEGYRSIPTMSSGPTMH